MAVKALCSKTGENHDGIPDDVCIEVLYDILIDQGRTALFSPLLGQRLSEPRRSKQYGDHSAPVDRAGS